MKMLHKTIVLEMLQQRPQMYEQLRRQKLLLATMEFYASELKALYEGWKQHLTATRPNLDPIQIASEAREMAVQELEDSLPSDSSSPHEMDHPSLDDLMTFLSAHTPPA
jgi:hypothetical protein